MDTSDFVSDADFLPNAPASVKPSGKGAPELLSDMSGVDEVTIQTPHKHFIRAATARQNTIALHPCHVWTSSCYWPCSY